MRDEGRGTRDEGGEWRGVNVGFAGMMSWS